MNFVEGLKLSRTTKLTILLIATAGFLSLSNNLALAQTTFAGNAQHTGIFTPPAVNMNVIKWQTDIDLNVTGIAHYGSPVISANNTVFVPVKISATGFRVDAFDGATGAFKYTVATDFIMPSSNWIPPYNICIVGTRLYFPGAGGTMWHIDNIDSNSPTTPVRQAFYGISSYNSNPTGFNSTVFVSSPIVADSAGNIFFGFRVQGTAPDQLGNQSGLARIAANGTGQKVFATDAANDALITRDCLNAGPALSNDESSVYFPVKSAASNSTHAYLVELNSTTLAVKNKVFLLDPRNGNGASITDISTSSPMVGPDGDVYFGVMANPGNGSRGFLLHFSADLKTTKIPGGFGWDYTPGIVPASMVPSYTGTSSYLLFCKYNDYPAGDSAGVNKVALLDPNATQVDPHASANGLVEMREVLSVIGFTPDNAGPSFPFAVQEFCINAPAVNPITMTVYFDSEDGRIYRWNVGINSVDQAVVLTPGQLQPYVPTVIGPDGTIYTLNGGNFFAIGPRAGVEMTIASSSPDLRRTVVGDSVTLTATVSGAAPIPTGTVTFTDLSHNGLTPVTTVLASNVPLDSNGRASITTSSLVANSTNFGNHIITASYSGDGSHQATSVTMVQKVHPQASVTTVTSSNPVVNPGDSVTFTATNTCIPNLAQNRPCGFITFYDGQNVIGQLPLNASGQAILVKSDLTPGSHAIRAEYTSDTIYAMSEGTIQQVVGPVVQFSSATFNANENAGRVDVQVSLVGSSQTAVTVQYATSDLAGTNGCTVNNGNASSRCDYLRATRTLTFSPGQTSKVISIPITDDVYFEGNETFTVNLSNITGANPGTPLTTTVTINDNDAVNGVNPIDNAGFFVRQHYIDFLNREPDAAGLAFWTNEITSCGSDAQCIEVKRINVSAAFFLSIEFQETGYFAYRVYKSAFGNLPGAPVPVSFSNFLPDSQQLQQGVQVGVGDWQTQLETNKQNYVLAFVQRPSFLADYPNSMTANEFVTQMNARAGGVLSATEQNNLIAVLGATPSDVSKRAQVLRAVADDADLRNAEFNRAFVLMQYFGYLRRSPNELPDANYDGFNFWLAKLDSFGGNFVNAELVKAFILSGEYRQRFGP